MTSPKALKIAALLQIRNGARYLKGYFENVMPHVQSFVVLDDGSTDGTLELLKAQQPSFLYHRISREGQHEWNETLNRKILIAAGQATGADWFLALDVDERIQQSFYDQIPAIIARAEQQGYTVVNLNLRESWQDAHHYRIDGIWGKKKKAIFFRNLKNEHCFDEAAWHGEWYSSHLNPTSDLLYVDLDILHLKMIHADDRQKRMELYQQLDPHREFQAIGYDYLVDETGLELKKIDYEVKGLE